MSLNLKLNITSSNIKQGERVNPGNCPIARRIRNQIKGLQRVSVLGDIATISKKTNGKYFTFVGQLPEVAKNFVKRFDNGQAVAPFSFKITLKKVKNAVALI